MKFKNDVALVLTYVACAWLSGVPEVTNGNSVRDVSQECMRP
jgi:hypothetical protein